MKTKKIYELNKAIEEAVKFGFTKHLFFINGIIKKKISGLVYSKQEFAVVKTFPVAVEKERLCTISYTVLSDGTLGYFIKEKNYVNKKKNIVEQYTHIEN